jgi:peptidoglycan/LPS O-acetylase OafA/YrhL
VSRACRSFSNMPGLRDLFGVPAIDGIVWTLEVEIKFYLVCALLAPWLRRASPWLLVALVIMGCAVEQRFVAAPYLPFMSIGTALHFNHRGMLPGKWLAPLVVAIGGFLCVAMPGYLQGSYATALGLFLIFYVARDHARPVAPLAWLSAISYPLYVVHGIMGYVAMRVMLDLSIPPVAAILTAFILALAVSRALHVAIELPTQRLGKEPRRWRTGAVRP